MAARKGRKTLRHSHGITLLCAAGLLTVLTACGDSSDVRTKGEGQVSRPAASATPVQRPGSVSAPPRASVGPEGEDAAAQEDEARKRAAAAPSGVPVSGEPFDPAKPDFENPLVSRGDVTVYRTIRTRTGLTVPVTITNTGRDRAAYTAEVKITGPQAFEAVLHVGTDGTPLYPGTSRPAELTATDPGKPVPSDPTITITRVTRTPDES